MPSQRKTSQEKISELKIKQKQLRARIQKEQAKITQDERKKDTRKKIIAGAITLEHMKHNLDFKQTMKEILEKYVKEADKSLFDL